MLSRENLLYIAGGALVLLILIIIITFASCGGEQEVELSASPSPVVTDTADPTPDETTPEPEYETVMIGTIVDVDSFLNVREAGSRSGAIIGKAYSGEQYTVLEKNVGDGGVWHRIVFGGAAAFVHEDYMVVDEIVRVKDTQTESE